MNCELCGKKITDDGHGELVHVIPVVETVAYRYGCKTGKVPSNESYPVAS